MLAEEFVGIPDLGNLTCALTSQGDCLEHQISSQPTICPVRHYFDTAAS